jgi:endonuclease YncB( thermonuclease family)
VYDGDTFTAIFFFRGECTKYRIRCLGYDAPEIRPRLNVPDREEVIRKARLARARLQELLTAHPCVWLRCGPFDKYGRILAHVSSIENKQRSFNETMLAEGHGVLYPGK